MCDLISCNKYCYSCSPKASDEASIQEMELIHTFCDVSGKCYQCNRTSLCNRIYDFQYCLNLLNTRADITNIFISEIKELCYEQYVLHRN